MAMIGVVLGLGVGQGADARVAVRPSITGICTSISTRS